jgi:hypothetical protein
MNPILVPVSPGELFDKKTILEIKRERIADAGKQQLVRHELALLETVAAQVLAAAPGQAAEVQALSGELKAVNERLWDLENAVRACERAQDFGPAFVASARKIYAGNDERAAVKLRINRLLGSAIAEAKEHAGPAASNGAGLAG